MYFSAGRWLCTGGTTVFLLVKNYHSRSWSIGTAPTLTRVERCNKTRVWSEKCSSSNTGCIFLKLDSLFVCRHLYYTRRSRDSNCAVYRPHSDVLKWKDWKISRAIWNNLLGTYNDFHCLIVYVLKREQVLAKFSLYMSPRHKFAHFPFDECIWSNIGFQIIKIDI